MKKTLLTTTAMLAMAVGAFGQGVVLFDNDSLAAGHGVNLLTVTGTPANPTAASNPGGAAWHMALLYNASTTPTVAQASMADIYDYLTTAAGDVPGNFEVDTSPGSGTPLHVPVPASGTATFEVVGWLGSATTWANALGGGASYTGESAEFELNAVTPTGSPPPAPLSVNSGSAWNGSLVLVSVPEPTTIALGGLGMAALMMFRRRK